MPELVMVSNVEKKKEELKTYLEGLFRQNRFTELSRAIGMHSILIDPQHTKRDQAELYRFVLDMIKDRISRAKGKSYALWYADFPRTMDKLVSENRPLTDKTAADVLASRRAAFGPFKSVDDFYFWALDDRRLPFDQIMKYIDATVSMTA